MSIEKTRRRQTNSDGARRRQAKIAKMDREADGSRRIKDGDRKTGGDRRILTEQDGDRRKKAKIDLEADGSRRIKDGDRKTGGDRRILFFSQDGDRR